MTTIITRSCAFYEDNSHNLNNIAVNGCVKVKEVKDDLDEPSVSFYLKFLIANCFLITVATCTWSVFYFILFFLKTGLFFIINSLLAGVVMVVKMIRTERLLDR